LVDELLACTFGLDVHQDTAGSLSLAAMARHGVAIVEMPAFLLFE
jgi:hypothetical protein